MTLYLGAMFNSKITKKMHKNVENAALKTVKRTLVYSMTAATSRPSVALFPPQLGNLCTGRLKNATILHKSTNDCNSSISSDFEVTKNFNE